MPPAPRGKRVVDPQTGTWVVVNRSPARATGPVFEQTRGVWVAPWRRADGKIGRPTGRTRAIAEAKRNRYVEEATQAERCGPLAEGFQADSTVAKSPAPRQARHHRSTPRACDDLVDLRQATPPRLRPPREHPGAPPPHRAGGIDGVEGRRRGLRRAGTKRTYAARPGPRRGGEPRSRRRERRQARRAPPCRRCSGARCRRPRYAGYSAHATSATWPPWRCASFRDGASARRSALPGRISTSTPARSSSGEGQRMRTASGDARAHQDGMDGGPPTARPDRGRAPAQAAGEPARTTREGRRGVADR